MKIDLVGVTEIAELLGVSTQRVSQLSKSADFPEPVARIAAGAIWQRPDVLEWAKRVGRLT